MRTGTADLPLHGGKCPPWLFSRMTRLGAAIIEAIVEEYGPQEVLRRLADPFWFQALGCVLGFDWHSSGLTTTVCGALKEGLAPRQGDLGLFFAGGKGKTSRKTPQEIQEAGEKYGLPSAIAELQYASRMVAKVDSAALQDGYQLYHHFFVFTADGSWAVVQQGMNEETRWARRYHWQSHGLRDFVCEPHAAVCGQRSPVVLNLVAREGEASRQGMTLLAREHPDRVLAEVKQIVEKQREEASPCRQVLLPSSSPGQTPSLPGLLPEQNWGGVGPPPGQPSSGRLVLPRPHYVPGATYLDKALRAAYERQPANFQDLLAVPGVGPNTLRALAMVAEVIYGARPSFRDPVRYSFAHGGKDGHPYPVDRQTYDHSIAVLEEALRKARIGELDRLKALRRLGGLVDQNTVGQNPTEG